MDTGASASIISEATKESIFPNAKLGKTSVALCAYSSEPLTVLGQMMVEVHHNGYVGTLPLLAVRDKGSSLMGRDWLSVIRIDWASIKVLALGKPPAMDSLQKYPDVFAPGLGTEKEIRANLSLKEGA